ELPLVVKDTQPAAALKSFLSTYPGRVLIAADTAGRREALLEVLQAADLRPEVLPDFQAFLQEHHPRGNGDPASSASTGEQDDARKSLGPRVRGDDDIGFVGNDVTRFAIAVA